MTRKKVELVFHSSKMLLTLDLQKVFEILVEEYGEELTLSVMPMTAAERAASEDSSGPVTLVPTRFILREVHDGKRIVRRVDIEERMIHEGRK